MNKVTRRNFMMSAASAAAAIRIVGANDRIRLGIIGPGGRGQSLMRGVNEAGGAEWVAVADVYGARMGEAEKVAGKALARSNDYRRLLDGKETDAVIIAAPDHWHARMLLDAVGAGKDVYCEKPMTDSPLQGHAIVKKVRESGRVVQIGTQQRSIPVIREAKQKFIESGLLGQITMVHCYWNSNRGYLMPRIPPNLERQPADLDWNAWLGALPKTPYDPKRYLRPYLFWGPSTGPTGNLLVHFLDMIHWYLSLEKPSSAIATGGLYHFKDGRDVPDTFSATLEYSEGLMVTFGCCFVDQARKEGVDVIFMGVGGRLHVFRDGYRFIPAEANASAGELTAEGRDGSYHVRNWLDCLRSRKEPIANVRDGHYLSASCQLANEAYRKQRKVAWEKSWNLPVV